MHRHQNTRICLVECVDLHRRTDLNSRECRLIAQVCDSAGHDTSMCLRSPAVCLCDFMMGHFSTSMPINEFGMGLILPMDIQAGSLTVGPLWWIAFLNYEVQSCHCFFSAPPASPLNPPSLPSLTIFFFSLWWIGFQPLSVNAISRGSCPIPPQRHMCGDTDQRKTRHFRAMGLGCMQHKTSNGGLASDRYWCTVGLYDTEQADRHKHARQCSAVMKCINDQT